MSVGEVDPDTAIVAADPLCQQALECQAEDMAIEDTLYALERALTDGHLPSDTYLKQASPLFFTVVTQDHMGLGRPMPGFVFAAKTRYTLSSQAIIAKSTAYRMCPVAQCAA